MEIKGITFASARQFAHKLKVTIHSSGKLGFTDAAAQEVGITRESGFQLGRDERGQMYLMHVNPCTEEAFHVICSKDYFSINPAALFDDWGIDYANPNRKYVYDLVRQKEITDHAIYLMKPRNEKKPRRNEAAERENQTEE